MIGYLEGDVKYSQTGKIILYANGVGFTVHTPSNLSYLIGDKAVLYVHTHLREDDLSLFGFREAEDLNLFEMLIKVSGIGPKIALAIFSVASSENIRKAISQSDLSFFTSVPGIGKKSAQKLILDLKSKVDKGDVDMAKLEGNSELVESLLALGFQKIEIQPVITQIDSSLPISDQVKTALKLLKR